MSFVQRVSAGAKRHLAGLEAAHDRRVREAEARAKVRLERAKTKAEREKAKLQLQREKMALKRELYEARSATQKAKVALKRARREAGGLTIGEKAEEAWRYFTKPPKKRRRVTRKRTARKK